MKNLLKSFLVLILTFSLTFAPVAAKDGIILTAGLTEDLKTDNILPEVRFVPTQSIVIDEENTIPEGAIVTAEIIKIQKERRWHKSGFIVCKLKGYQDDKTGQYVDLSSGEIYFTAYKYEQLDKKEASILATEIVLTQAVALFAPGVDILYFFVKGAIQGKKDANRFKAGVHNAYDNSVCWFWLKGKPIDLDKSEQVQIKEINDKKALKLTKQIERRNQKQAFKDGKKQVKLNYKEQKKIIKTAYKEQKQLQKNKLEDNEAEESIILVNEKYTTKSLKKSYKQQRKQIRQEKKIKINEINVAKNNYKTKLKAQKKEELQKKRLIKKAIQEI